MKSKLFVNKKIIFDDCWLQKSKWKQDWFQFDPMPFFKIKIPWLLKFVPFCCTVEWIWSISNGRCGVSGTLNGAFLDYRPRPVKVIFELHMQMKSFQDFFFWSNPDIIYIQDIHDIKKIKNDFNGLCLILYFRSIFNRWPLSFRAFFCPKKGCEQIYLAALS